MQKYSKQQINRTGNFRMAFGVRDILRYRETHTLAALLCVPTRTVYKKIEFQ